MVLAEVEWRKIWGTKHTNCVLEKRVKKLTQKGGGNWESNSSVEKEKKKKLANGSENMEVSKNPKILKVNPQKKSPKKEIDGVALQREVFPTWAEPHFTEKEWGSEQDV